MGAPTIGPRDDRPGRVLYTDAESDLGRIVEPGVQAVIWLAGERPPWLAEVAATVEESLMLTIRNSIAEARLHEPGW